jgi:hypothetical protein
MVRSILSSVIVAAHNALWRMSWTPVSCQDRTSDPRGYLLFQLDLSSPAL